jgi:glycosyltransferase involved in cell wall biosynthesis
MPKIAIYAISKNESKFVERFMKSCKGADYIVVADTGSTDDTREKLQAEGAIIGQIAISPWRFDKARNASLELVPEDADICICLDLDEILINGWREHLEKAYRPEITRYRYKYTWSWRADGTADLIYNGDKIHSRRDYVWGHPVHETLRWVGESGKENYGWADLQIEHYPDGDKSRSNYLGLLELAVREDPLDDRNSHYLGREYFFVYRYTDAIAELKRHLLLPRATWNAERAASMRYISQCYNKLSDQKERTAWALRAVAEAPEFREPWCDLAQAYYDNKDYLGGYYAAKHALAIKERQNTYLTLGSSWSELPHDLAGTCAFYVEQHLEAYEHTLRANTINPNDIRIQGNLKFMEDYIKEHFGQEQLEVIRHMKKVAILEETKS